MGDFRTGIIKSEIHASTIEISDFIGRNRSNPFADHERQAQDEINKKLKEIDTSVFTHTPIVGVWLRPDNSPLSVSMYKAESLVLVKNPKDAVIGDYLADEGVFADLHPSVQSHWIQSLDMVFIPKVIPGIELYKAWKRVA